MQPNQIVQPTGEPIFQPEPNFKTAWMTVERMSILLGMLSMAFLAGANWHRIDAVETRVFEVVAINDKHKDTYEREFVRKDVVQEQLSNINSQLTEIRAQLQSVKLAQRAK